MTSTDDGKKPENLSLESLEDALDSGDISIEDILENEAIRRRITRLLIQEDLEEHREIYDRLAEV